VARSGSTEIEVKLKISDPPAIERRLSEARFHIASPRVFEANTLFDFSGETLRARGSMLRLRQAGEKTILTFKGPAERAKHKSREELETTLGDATVFGTILDRIGLHAGFRYEKYRTEYQRVNESGVVTLDETPIGWFLELEGEPDWIDHTAIELGFTERDYITLSYGGLYTRHCEETGAKPDSMIFEKSSKV
jgi:adenylate cyclase, class 2